MRVSAEVNSISIYPTAIDEIHVIQQDELVGRGHQLKVTNVGQKIRLHDGETHRVIRLLLQSAQGAAKKSAFQAGRVFGAPVPSAS